MFDIHSFHLESPRLFFVANICFQVAGLQFSLFPLKTNRQTNKIKRKTDGLWNGSTKSSHGAFRFQKLVPKFPLDPLKSSTSETGHKVRHAQTHSPSLFTIFQFLYYVRFRWNWIRTELQFIQSVVLSFWSLWNCANDADEPNETLSSFIRRLFKALLHLNCSPGWSKNNQYNDVHYFCAIWLMWKMCLLFC